MFEQTKALCQHFLKMGIPGFDLAVYKDGECVLRYMDGYADPENKIPMRGNEKYHVYSNSFKCQFIFSELKYINQANGKKVKECLIELQCYKTHINLEKFFEFANRIEKSVKPIYPYDKTKFEMGLEITKSNK